MVYLAACLIVAYLVITWVLPTLIMVVAGIWESWDGDLGWIFVIGVVVLAVIGLAALGG